MYQRGGTIRTGGLAHFRRQVSSVHIPGFQQTPHLRLVVSQDEPKETLFARLEESRRAREKETEKAKGAWATQTYDSVEDLLYDDCRFAVGKIDGQGIAGYETINEIIQGFTILEDITELLAAANRQGYQAVFRYAEGTTIFVEYKQGADHWTLWKYHRDTEATVQLQNLQKKEPTIEDEYLRRKYVSEDLGVLICTDDKKIYASLCVERKKPGVYSPPLQRTYATVDQAIKDFQESIPPKIRTMFPNPEEKKLFEEGKEIIFGLFFQGFGYRGEDRALRCVLKTAYRNGIQQGIGTILENVDALYHKNGPSRQENTLQKELTVDEWFEKIYLKASGKEEEVAQRIVVKNDPAYKTLFERHKRPKHTLGEPFVVRTVLITPTLEGIQAAYAIYQACRKQAPAMQQ
jgi:hypothetical protein